MDEGLQEFFFVRAEAATPAGGQQQGDGWGECGHGAAGIPKRKGKRPLCPSLVSCVAKDELHYG
jgi:hypothetical protein